VIYPAESIHFDAQLHAAAATGRVTVTRPSGALQVGQIHDRTFCVPPQDTLTLRRDFLVM